MRIPVVGALWVSVSILAGCVGASTSARDDAPLFRGTVRAAERWTLGFEVDGVVREIGVRPGTRVGVGEWIASLDAEPFDRAVTESRDRLRVAKARRAQLGGTLWTDHGNAVVPALALASVSREAEQLPTDVGAFDASVAASAAALRRAVALREGSELRSSTSGRVTAVAMRVGDRIAAGAPAVMLENDERFEVVVRVPAPVPASVRVGSTAEGEWSEDGKVRRAGLRVLDLGAAATGDGGAVEVILAFSERLATRPKTEVGVRFRP